MEGSGTYAHTVLSCKLRVLQRYLGIGIYLDNQVTDISFGELGAGWDISREPGSQAPTKFTQIHANLA